jgi:putative DNA primase/helicase
MIAADIAAVLPRARKIRQGSYLVSCPVPEHGRGRGDLNPSLQITDDEQGLQVRCHAGCDPCDVLEALRNLPPEREQKAQAATSVQSSFSLRSYEREQQRKALWLWRRRKPITGTIAEKYLRTRGITGSLPETLAFLPPSKRDQHPALIAPFAIDANTPVDSVHLTLLAPDGSGKADVENPKIIVGRPLGRPIVLSAPNDTLALAITEGIEDALTVAALTGLETWAAGSAGFLPTLADAIPDCIETVTIFAHDDEAGRAGALSLATRLYGLAIEIFVEGIV